MSLRGSSQSSFFPWSESHSQDNERVMNIFVWELQEEVPTTSENSERLQGKNCLLWRNQELIVEYINHAELRD